MDTEYEIPVWADIEDGLWFVYCEICRADVAHCVDEREAQNWVAAHAGEHGYSY